MARAPNSTPDSTGKTAIATKNSHSIISNSHSYNSKSIILNYINPNAVISTSIQRSPHHPSSRNIISTQHPDFYTESTLIRVIIIGKALTYSSKSIVGMWTERPGSTKKETGANL